MDRNLLVKYLEGLTSPEETTKVEDWILYSSDNARTFNRIKTNLVIGSLGKTPSEEEKDETFENFKAVHLTGGKTLSSKWIPLLRYAAAIVLALMTTFLVYYGLGQKEQLIVPDNAITLKQEDGSIKVIDDIGNSNVQDGTGNIIAKQIGKSLVYSKDASNSKLEYSTLTVPFGKTFEVVLSDGTYVHLNSGSSLRYPIQFIEGIERQVFVRGEAFFDVAKDSLHPFLVSAAQLNVKVLGTTFNVSAYKEDEVTEVVLVEGSVSLFSTSNGDDPIKNTMMEPGYKASFEKIPEGITLTPVTTDVYTSWRQGELAFRNMTLENILKKLERHYNINIINMNASISKKRFNANFGNEPILSNVLEDLKRNYGIGYKIERNIITIY
mgnify:CR=1 FL=1|tara:strand:+ start:6622 stop:7767 length:1146 start_codon:yes stop_codon:yes gene_type:complete